MTRPVSGRMIGQSEIGLNEWTSADESDGGTICAAMGPRRTVALMGVLRALTIAVPPAAHAFPANGGTETATVNAGPDGLAVARTDQLPAKVTRGSTR